MLNLGSLKYVLFNTLIGEIAIIWNTKDKTIKQIVLPDFNTKKYNYGDMNYHGVLLEDNPNEFILDLVSKIKDIIEGKEVHFELDKLDLSGLTDFQKRVLLKQTEIPHGKVTTYKKLAQLIGRPNSARPVANALANNPFPLIIPCHRTVKSDWTIGGYNGTINGYYKQLILENEGVQLDNNQVNKKYHYPQ